MTSTNIKVHHLKSIHMSVVHLKSDGGKHENRDENEKEEEFESDSQAKHSGPESWKVYGLYTKNKKGKPKGKFAKVTCSCSELKEGDRQISYSLGLSEDIQESINTAFQAFIKLLNEVDSIEFKRTKFEVKFDDELPKGKYSSLAIGVAIASAFYKKAPKHHVLVAGMLKENGNTTSRENIEFIIREAEACNIEGVKVAIPNVNIAAIGGRKMFLTVSNLHGAAMYVLCGFRGR